MSHVLDLDMLQTAVSREHNERMLYCHDNIIRARCAQAESAEARHIVLTRARAALECHSELCAGIAVELSELSACLLDCGENAIVDSIDDTGIVDVCDMCLLI